MKTTYYLGKDSDSNLCEYVSAKQAAWESEEWVTVYAENLKEAKEMYEETFAKWQEEQAKKLNP